MGWTAVAIAALTGFGGGALASVLGPWAAWGVEKRRERRAERDRLHSVAHRRLMNLRGDAASKELDHNWYAIRGYLRPDTVALVEAQEDAEAARVALAKDLHRLGRRWRLT